MKKNLIKNTELDRRFREAILEVAEIKGRKYIEEAEQDPYMPSIEFYHRIQDIIESKTRTSRSFYLSDGMFFTYS